MPLMRILKENHVLVAGILLPLFLVGLLTLAKAFPFHVVPDPTFRAVYAMNNYGGSQRFTYAVTDQGKLEIFFLSPKIEGQYNYGTPIGRIFIFTPSTGHLEDTILTVPVVKKGQEKTPVESEKFSKYKLSGQITAPDGYMYENKGYSRSSLVTDILSFHSSGPLHTLTKNGRQIPLPNPTNVYGEVIFIGWIIEESK